MLYLSIRIGYGGKGRIIECIMKGILLVKKSIIEGEGYKILHLLIGIENLLCPRKGLHSPRSLLCNSALPAGARLEPVLARLEPAWS